MLHKLRDGAEKCNFAWSTHMNKLRKSNKHTKELSDRSNDIFVFRNRPNFFADSANRDSIVLSIVGFVVQDRFNQEILLSDQTKYRP